MILSWSEYSSTGKAWGDYKDYLASAGGLSPELIATPVKPNVPHEPLSTEAKPPVPWACMGFEAASEAGLLPQVESHIHNVLSPDKAIEYLLYLSWTGFPNDFIQYHKNNLKSS